MNALYIFLGFLVFWLSMISFFLFKTRLHYNNLIQRTKKRRIDDVLDQLIEKDENNTKEIAIIKKNVEEIIYKSKFYYQKIGFLRFNPFDRVGGDQSFIIALLDSENTGLILNFLYTREGMRIYSKKVKSGVSEEYELSVEEKEAIKKAR